MRPAPDPILPALLRVLLPAALLLTPVPAEARPRQQHRPHERPHDRAVSDMDATLAGMAARDRLRGWRLRQAPRPLARFFPPATRERVAAPPFTGWGYGGTIPGAWPGF